MSLVSIDLLSILINMTLFGSDLISTTDTVTLCETNPQFQPSLELLEFKIKGMQYTREIKVAKVSKERRKISPIWRYGEALLRKRLG
jgi:hypothetical protein